MMTLLLGAPGLGKLTFLKALAGKLDPSLKVDLIIRVTTKTLSIEKH
jgi:ABC-type multidrug transport system ATPase subunit